MAWLAAILDSPPSGQRNMSLLMMTWMLGRVGFAPLRKTLWTATVACTSRRTSRDSASPATSSIRPTTNRLRFGQEFREVEGVVAAAAQFADEAARRVTDFVRLWS